MARERTYIELSYTKCIKYNTWSSKLGFASQCFSVKKQPKIRRNIECYMNIALEAASLSGEGKKETPIDAEFNHVDSSKPWQNQLWRFKSYLLQILVGSAFFTIQGCSMIFWRDSLFEESFTRSCTYFQITYSGTQLNIFNTAFPVHPDINMKIESIDTD